LRGGTNGSLGGETSTVQEHRERMDEGEQAEQRQTSVHLQTHGGERRWSERNNDRLRWL